MSYTGHYSVLKQESINLLGSLPDDAILIDCTLGEAGHTLLALNQFPSIHVIGLDADPVMMNRAKEKLEPFAGRVSLFNQWADDFLMHYPHEFQPPQAILMDLGLSMFHFACAGRGFSFRDDEELDMRLNPQGRNAYDLVNFGEEKELADILWRYGEEKKSRQIARAIIIARGQAPIKTASELASVIRGCFGGKPSAHHPAIRSFQAIRIAVNDELNRLERALKAAWQLLPLGGRLAIISFHSLEDRIVKQFMAEKSKACHCPPHQMQCNCQGALGTLINKGGTIPSDMEIAENAASRSARLRVIEKIREELNEPV